MKVDLASCFVGLTDRVEAVLDLGNRVDRLGVLVLRVLAGGLQAGVGRLQIGRAHV